MKRTPSAAARLRNYCGAASLVLFFLVALSTMLVPSSGGEDPAGSLSSIAADPGATVALGWTLLIGAVLLLGGVLFLAGATRGRGAAWGAAGLVTGVLGAIGLSIVAMHSFIEAALAQLPLGSSVVTAEALDTLAGWIVFPLLTCQVMSMALFAVALARSGTVHWWVAAVAGAAAVLAMFPIPMADPLVFGLCLLAMGWAAAAIVRRRAAAGWAEEPAPVHRVWAGAACAVALLVLSMVKDVLFPGSDDPDSALGVAGSSPAPFVTEGLMALGIAVLFGGAVAFFAGAVRGRGSGLAIAGTVLGCAGAVSIGAMGVLDFLTAAIAASHAGTAVFGPLGGILFPAFMPLFLAENLMMVAFAAALWRAGTVSWGPLVLAAAFAVIGQVHPTGLAAVGQMLVGLVAAAWLAYGVLRARGAVPAVVRGAGTEGKRTTAPAPARGALG